MMTLLYLLLLPMLSGIGMLGLGPALMAGRAGAAHVVLLLSGLLLPLRGLIYLLLARRRGNRPGRMSVLLAAVELLLGAGLLLLPQLSVRLFAVVVAVYLTLLVTVEAVNAILYGRMRRWGAFFPAMAAAVGGTGLFVLIVFVPALRDAALRYTAALLLTVFGTGLVCDVLALTIRSRPRPAGTRLDPRGTAGSDELVFAAADGGRAAARSAWPGSAAGDGGV